MKNILSISMNNDQLTDLIAYAFNAGRVVGRKDAKRANVYAVQKDGATQLVTTFNNEVPGFYSVLVASARWSTSRGEYVIVANEFLAKDIVEVWHLDKPRAWTIVDLVVDALDRGVSTGVEEHDQAVAINQKAETVEERIVVMMNLMSGGVSAWFFDREDAELWALQEVGDKNVRWSVVGQTEADGDMAKLILQDREETMVYRAWVSNEPA